MAVHSSHSYVVSIQDDGEIADPVTFTIDERPASAGFLVSTLRFRFADCAVYLYVPDRGRLVEIVRSLYDELGAILQSADHDHATPAPGFIAGGYPVQSRVH
jgi:hypothetical protein